MQWQTEEHKKLELADLEAETKQNSFKELKVGEWAELYEYAFKTFTKETYELAKETQRAFKRSFETKVISPEVHVSSVRKKGIIDVFNALKKKYSGKIRGQAD